MIAIMKGSCKLRRLEHANKLKLPYIWEKAIQNVIHENRMNFEVWVESAQSQQDLINKISKRGYSQLNGSLAPIVNLASLPIKDILNVKHFRLGSEPQEANHNALKKLEH